MMVQLGLHLVQAGVLTGSCSPWTWPMAVVLTLAEWLRCSLNPSTSLDQCRSSPPLSVLKPASCLRLIRMVVWYPSCSQPPRSLHPKWSFMDGSLITLHVSSHQADLAGIKSPKMKRKGNCRPLVVSSLESR